LGSGSPLINQTKYWLYVAILSTKVILLLLSFSYPKYAEAGVISSVFGLFEKSEAKSVVLKNSQNMALLQAAINPDPNPIKGGGNITIVEGTSLLAETGPSGSMADIENIPKSDQISVYVVREGDSLSQIAKMFGVSINTILWANDLSSGTIREGQTLIILPVSGVRHVVKSGETIKSITNKYKGDYEEVLAYNGLSKESTIKVGDVVVVPDGEINALKPSVNSSGSISRGSNGPEYSGYYMRPVGGGRKSQGLHGYNGVDLATDYGSPIFASADGIVLISKNSGWNGGYGNYIVINHDNGTQTLYAHNSNNIVYPGQSVVKGQVIGYVGSTGKSTGNHLHFEIRGAKNPF
jgi:LysM repeat protein